MARTEYYEIPTLKDIYLEDSYVLDIVESATELRLLLDMVLTESHPDYQPPPRDEQYCFRKGELVFQSIDTIRWHRKTMRPIYDANAQIDYGNVDSLYEENGLYHLEGEWGVIEIAAHSVVVRMHHEAHGV
jgi:hypothetical protein